MLHGKSSAGSNFASTQESLTGETAATPTQSAENTSLVASRTSSQRPTSVLLATAWISVASFSGRQMRVRTIVDQNSEMTFVSESVAELLKLKRIRFPVSVETVGGINAGTLLLTYRQKFAVHVAIFFLRSLRDTVDYCAFSYAQSNESRKDIQ
ncbi:hypothetical protein PUN28_003591 [Cardiocondyla obscurior]|uniref:Uncharacterized protein n=1 Tax=Cardiocondyla obscurior TaxID=286306 RepID=A0AAW2GP37_9HYME